MTREVAVLIIDDNEDDRELCVRSLKKAFSGRFRSIELPSGDKAIEVIKKEAPNCILLDYSLPGRNGLEVLKRVRAKFKNLPVIILTGQGNETVAVKAMKLGAQDYIVKSNINEETIYHIVLMAIEHCDLKDRIEKQQQALSLFTRALAHDLKEPVRTILSFSNLMKESELPTGQKAYLDRIESSANSMARLINSVRVYTELADLSEVELQKCNLDNIAKQAIKKLEKTIEDSGATINLKDLPEIHGNPDQLIQVFQNIIGNAITHTPENRDIRISISAQDKGDHYQIVISDSGIGIDEAYINSIFEPFKRLGGQSRDHSGLGLAICKRIIEAQGGRIWAKSTLGKGTKINFTLSKYTGEEDEDPTIVQTDYWPEHEKNFEGEENANILLVDDSIDDLYLTRIVLQEKSQINFNMFFAQNGVEALDFLNNSEHPPIDLIILDINMPVMDGFEFLKKRQESSVLRKYPVVMCSTSDYAKDKELAKELGAVAYIVKPLSKEHFLNAIDRVDTIKMVNRDSLTVLKPNLSRRA